MNASRPRRSPAAPVVASGPTRSPWLKILATCALATGVCSFAALLAAFFVAGAAGAASAVLGAALVMVFFGISLLIGHYVGRHNPSGAIGAFIATYVIKVAGFGAALFILGAPAWLDRTWFFVAAVAGVVVWQGAEVYAFSRIRHQIYADPADTGGREG
jgi:ATP synthase protein I